MTTPDSAAAPNPKAALRRRMRALLPADDLRATLSQALRERLAPWLSTQPEQEREIALFSPLPGEPDLLALPEMLPDFHWSLPRVEGSRLFFHRYTGLAGLQPGAFGIAEPDPASEVIPIGKIRLFLCPGLAFSSAGVRLGRGKGFYDRALAGAAPDAIFTGVCFPHQLLPELPAEPHDRPMHYLATSDGVTQATEQTS